MKKGPSNPEQTRSGCTCGPSEILQSPLTERAYRLLRDAPVPDGFRRTLDLRAQGLLLGETQRPWLVAGDALPSTMPDGPDEAYDFEEVQDVEAMDDDVDAVDDEELLLDAEEGDEDLDPEPLVEYDADAALNETVAETTAWPELRPHSIRLPSLMTDWRFQQYGSPSQSPARHSLIGVSLSGMVTNSVYPDFSFSHLCFYTPRTGPLSRGPQTRMNPVDVAGHGRVQRGRTEFPLPGGGTRPYIWLWFEPFRNHGCQPGGAHHWYQFVQISFYYRGKLKFPDVRPPMEAATGRNARFRRNRRKSRWDADYHKKDHADKRTRGPGFRPPGLKIPKGDPGRPFRQYDIPGTTASLGGTTRHKGILDAPDFCGSRNPPPILRAAHSVLRKSFKQREGHKKPAPRERDASIVVNARSYLTCIKGGKVVCLGYLPWTYTQTTRVRFTWKEVGTAGGTAKKYSMTSQLLRCASELSIGDWKAPC